MDEAGTYLMVEHESMWKEKHLSSLNAETRSRVGISWTCGRALLKVSSVLQDMAEYVSRNMGMSPPKPFFREMGEGFLFPALSPTLQRKGAGCRLSATLAHAVAPETGAYTHKA